jgi:hypothetical protein
MDHFGLLTISFNYPISMPSYLLKDAMRDSVGVSQNDSKPKRRLNLFWPQSTFEINEVEGKPA